MDWEREDTRLALAGLALAVLGALLVAAWGAWGDWHLGAPGTDAAKGVWGVWWSSSPEVRGGSPLLYTKLLHFPEGTTFFPPDPLNVAAVAPVAALLGAPAGYSFLLVFQLLAGVVAGYAFLRLAGGFSRPACALGSLVFGLAPYQWCNVHEGVSETGALVWVALFATCWVRFSQRPRPSLGLALLAVHGALLLTNLYYAVFVLLFAGLWTVLHARGLWRSRALVGVLLALLALAGVSKGAQALMGSIYGTDASSGIKQGYVAIGERADLSERKRASYVGTSPAALVAVRARPSDVYRQQRVRSEYLGIAVCALALLGLLKAPRRAAPWLAVALAFLLFALGTGFGFENKPLVGETLRPLLPFPRLMVLQPILTMMNFPYRAVVMVNLGFAWLAALGADGLLGPLRPSRRALAAGLIGLWIGVEFAVLSGAPIPPGTSPITRPAYCEFLRRAPEPGAVLDFPIAQVHLFTWVSEYFTRAMDHRRPIPYSFAPDIQVLWDVGLTAPDGLFTHQLGNWPHGKAMLEAMGTLRRKGFAYAVLHQELYAEEAHRVLLVWLRRDLEAAMGPPVLQDGPHLVFRLPEAP